MVNKTTPREEIIQRWRGVVGAVARVYYDRMGGRGSPRQHHLENFSEACERLPEYQIDIFGLNLTQAYLDLILDLPKRRAA